MIVAAVVLFLVAVQGCSPGPRMTVASGQMYEETQLDEFVKETGPELGATPEYQIGIGDRLDILFLYHSNLSARELLVRPDGRISMPYVGDEVAMGRTPMELDSVLTDKFSEILKEPELSVILHEPAVQKVYVLGNVRSAGDHEIERPISLLQAIALAGGFGPGAKPQNTVLIRRVALDKIVGIEIDVKAIMKGEAVQSDIMLRNYDIVFVPQSRLTSLADFARQVHDIINLPLDAALDGWQIANQKASYEFWRDNRNNNSSNNSSNNTSN